MEDGGDHNVYDNTAICTSTWIQWRVGYSIACLVETITV